MKYDEIDVDVESLSRGNEMEWDKLAFQYNKVLQDNAYAVTRDVNLAQDVVQSVLLSMWVNRSRLSSIQSLSAYLKRAIRNSAISHMHKWNDRNRIFMPMEQLDCTTDVKMSEPVQKLHHKELRDALDLMRNHLTASQKKVFDALSSNPDASSRQIGQTLSCSHQNVRSAISRIRHNSQYISVAIDGVTL